MVSQTGTLLQFQTCELRCACSGDGTHTKARRAHDDKLSSRRKASLQLSGRLRLTRFVLPANSFIIVMSLRFYAAVQKSEAELRVKEIHAELESVSRFMEKNHADIMRMIETTK